MPALQQSQCPRILYKNGKTHETIPMRLNTLIDLIPWILLALLNVMQWNTQAQVIDENSQCSFSGESIECLTGQLESF